tara:strand:- start:87 stop:467 length:381 start_codon:yes stop_codon:yes gene_type:complete
VSGTRNARLAIVFGASAAALALMMVTVEPQVQYSVDELMDDPTEYEDDEIFVRGVVSTESVSHDNLTFQLDGVSKNILVDFTRSPIPDGFDEGRTIAVRGLLKFDDGSWVIHSMEIQTGCPSKYEA